MRAFQEVDPKVPGPGPDTNETTLILARREVQMAGRFVGFTPSPDPKQLGHIVPVGISTLDHDTRCRIVGLIKSGPDVPIAAEGDEV